MILFTDIKKGRKEEGKEREGKERTEERGKEGGRDLEEFKKAVRATNKVAKVDSEI